MKIEKINDHQIRCTLTGEDLASRNLKLSELAYGSERARELFRDMMVQAQSEVGFEADNVPLMIEAIPMGPDSIVLIISKVEDPEELDTRFSKFAQDNGQTASPSQDSSSIAGADDILDIFQQLVDKSRSRKKKAEESSNRKSDDSLSAASKEGTVDHPSASSHPQKAEDAKVIDVTEEILDSQPLPNLTRFFYFNELDTVIHAAGNLAGIYSGANTLYKDQKDRYLLVLHQTDHSPEEFNKICNILSEYAGQKAGTAAGEAYLTEHGRVLVADHALQQLSSLSR